MLLMNRRKKEKIYIFEFNAKKNKYNIDSGGRIQKTAKRYLLGILNRKAMLFGIRNVIIVINAQTDRLLCSGAQVPYAHQT